MSIIKRNMPNQSTSQGFTILEVMIALFVLSVGLLGMAGLQATGINYNYEAYKRTIAMQQAMDMAERIRTNITGANGGSYSNVTTTLITEPSACIHKVGTTLPDCDSAAIASNDIYEWNKSNASLLLSGRGTVTKTGDLFTITVMWDEARTGETGENCSGNFSTDLKCYSLSFQL